jgi:CBS domain-containing protein
MPTVEETMTRDPICCSPDEGVVDCAKKMEEHDVGMIPVVESLDTRKLIGVVTDRDLCLTVVAGGKSPGDSTVEECMTDEVISVAPGDDLGRALELMKQNQIRRLPVVDESGACVGVLAQADVVSAVAPKLVKETMSEISRPAT